MHFKESCSVTHIENFVLFKILFNDSRYRRKAALYDERIRELNEVSQAADEVKKNHDDLRKRRSNSQYSFLYISLLICSLILSVLSCL